MRHQLDDAGRITLLRATAEMPSEYAGTTIHCGEHAVAVETPGKYDSMLWYSLHDVDAFAAELQSFTPTERGELERFGPHNRLTYNHTTTGAGCRVCGNSKYGDKHIIRLERSLSAMPWIHLDCATEFADIITSVWDHAPELLAERV